MKIDIGDNKFFTQLLFNDTGLGDYSKIDDITFIIDKVEIKGSS